MSDLNGNSVKGNDSDWFEIFTDFVDWLGDRIVFFMCLIVVLVIPAAILDSCKKNKAREQAVLGDFIAEAVPVIEKSNELESIFAVLTQHNNRAGHDRINLLGFEQEKLLSRILEVSAAQSSTPAGADKVFDILFNELGTDNNYLAESILTDNTESGLKEVYFQALIAKNRDHYTWCREALLNTGVISAGNYTYITQAYNAKHSAIEKEQVPSPSPSAWNVNEAGFYEFDSATGATPWKLVEGSSRISKILAEKV